MSTPGVIIGSLTFGTANTHRSTHQTATHRLPLQHIFKAVRPTHHPWAPPPGQATSSLRTHIAEDIEAHPAAGIGETAQALVLVEAAVVEGSRADTGVPVAAVPELPRVSLRMQAQDEQHRKQAPV